jgi:hypothetical protein
MFRELVNTLVIIIIIIIILIIGSTALGGSWLPQNTKVQELISACHLQQIPHVKVEVIPLLFDVSKYIYS